MLVTCHVFFSMLHVPSHCLGKSKCQIRSGSVYRAPFTLSLFLILLSGDEMGMLEDACVSITNLTCVKFKVQVNSSILSKHEGSKGQSENHGSLEDPC